MATHKDHGLGKVDKTSDEEDYHRTREHSGPPESPQSHALPLSPASLSWEDEAFPISTPNTDMYTQIKVSEENISISEDVPNLPGPSTKEGKIPGYGKFAAFLQEEEEENVEDFLDEEDDDLYDPEEEEEEISSSRRGQLESGLHSQDAEEDSIPPRKVSIPAEEKETLSISIQQKAEANNLQEEKEDEKNEKDIPEYSTNAKEGVSLKSEERLKAVSYNKKKQGTVNVSDEQGEARITEETLTHVSMPSVYAQDQVLESSSDEKPMSMSSCQQDGEAHVLTKQHESANTFTPVREGAHTPKDHKIGTDSPSRAVRNTVGPSSEQEENSFKLPEQEEPALTECIQQGESLLQRLHVVQQKQQSPEVSEEFPCMTNQSAGLAGNSDAGERGTSLTGPDREDSCGEEKDGDGNDAAAAAAGPSHWQPVSPGGLEVLDIPGERVRASAVELQLSDGDDQSDSGVSADFSPCGLPEVQASAAASTAATTQPAPGTPAQRRRHLSSGQEGSSQAESEVDDGLKGSETEQIPTLRDPLEGQSSFAAEGTVEAQEERQDSVRKKMGQQMQSNVNEEEAAWMGKMMGEYSEGSVRKFKERRMLFEAFQQARPAEEKPPAIRPKRIISTSFSAFSLSSVATRQITEERIQPSVSVMERARSLEQLSQAQEIGVPWLRDSGWGTQDERDRIIVEGDVTLVHRRRSLRPSHSSESLYSRKEKEKLGEGAVGEEDEDEDESTVLHRQNPFFQLRPSLALRPDVARDIRDAREREKELRRLRRGLYGSWKKRRHSRGSASTTISQADSGSMAEDFQSRGKLELVWPPPSPTEKVSQCDQTQELRPLISPSQKALLWQRWQMGTVNGHIEEDD